MRNPPIRKMTWQDRAKNVREYHISMVKNDSSWGIRETAQALNRSYGGVAEDIMLAELMKSYPRLERIKNLKDAIKEARVITNKLRLEV